MARDDRIPPEAEAETAKEGLRRGIERSRALLNDYRGRLLALKDRRSSARPAAPREAQPSQPLAAETLRS